MRAYRWTTLLGLVWVLGCQRSAPSPERCHEFALTRHGLVTAAGQAPRSPTEAPLALPAEVERSVRQLTLRCLTQPFPTEFVDCVNEGNSPHSCEGYSSQGAESAEQRMHPTR